MCTLYTDGAYTPLGYTRPGVLPSHRVYSPPGHPLHTHTRWPSRPGVLPRRVCCLSLIRESHREHPRPTHTRAHPQDHACDPAIDGSPPSQRVCAAAPPRFQSPPAHRSSLPAASRPFGGALAAAHSQLRGHEVARPRGVRAVLPAAPRLPRAGQGPGARRANAMPAEPGDASSACEATTGSAVRAGGTECVAARSACVFFCS